MRLEDVSGLREYYDTHCFIATTNYDNLKNTTEALDDKKYGYVIVCGEKKMQEIKGWVSIIQQKFDDRIYLTLMKKVKAAVGNSVQRIYWL